MYLISGEVFVAAAAHVRAHFMAIEHQFDLRRARDQLLPEILAIVGVSRLTGAIGVRIARAFAITILAIALVAGDDEIVREQDTEVFTIFFLLTKLQGPLDHRLAWTPFERDDQEFAAIWCIHFVSRVFEGFLTKRVGRTFDQYAAAFAI